MSWSNSVQSRQNPAICLYIINKYIHTCIHKSVLNMEVINFHFTYYFLDFSSSSALLWTFLIPKINAAKVEILAWCRRSKSFMKIFPFKSHTSHWTVSNRMMRLNKLALEFHFFSSSLQLILCVDIGLTLRLLEETL